MSLESQLAADFSNVIDYDMPQNIQVGRLNFTALVEDMAETDIEEKGGSDLVGNTRIHFKQSDVAKTPDSFVSGGQVTWVNRKLDLMILYTSISPDNNHLIATCSRP